MAEISMVQMTGPAVSPGASAQKTQGGQAADFSELLRDKGQSVSDSDRKTEAKRSEKEQSQTCKPDKKVEAQKDEKQEANESASSLENTEEGLLVLAGMMMQQAQEADTVTVEGTAETASAEQVLLTESIETVPLQAEQLPQRTEQLSQRTEQLSQRTEQLPTADAQATTPVQEAAQALQSQDTNQIRQTAPQEAAWQESHVENTVEQTRQPQQVEQAVTPEQPRQENQAADRKQGEAGADSLKKAETTVRPEEQLTAQSTANSQFQSQLSTEGTEVPGETTAAVKTSEATMYRDIAETLASRMPVKDGTLTLELEPASLGKIIIKVAFEDGKTVMSLMADSHRTLAILSQRAGEMGQILEEKTGQQTVIYTPENQPSQEELPERGGEENRQRQRDAQEENRHNKESESFMQQLRLGLVG